MRHHRTNSRKSTSAQPTLIVYRDTLLQETTEVRTSSSYFLHDPKALLQALNWVFIAAASPWKLSQLEIDFHYFLRYLENMKIKQERQELQ